MVVIGVDPHKRTHTAAALEQTSQQQLASLEIEASLIEYRRLLSWAGQWSDRRWAVENARGLGRHLAQWLLARGETVVDVSAAATRRVRELSRGGRRKTDVIDAAAAAAVVAARGEILALAREDTNTVLGVLDERRVNLAAQRVRLVNQLHALLRDLLPGGAPTGLSATRASALLRAIRPASVVERTRKQLARDMIVELRGIDARLKTLTAQMAEVVQTSGSRLLAEQGVGPVLAARLLARTGDPQRFPSGSAFGSYTGTAPIEIASADKTRHRLSRSGDRQLNAAIHVIAVTQARMPSSPGRAYLERRLAEGKSRNEALRCLKRKIAERLWRIMLADHRRSSSPPSTATA